MRLLLLLALAACADARAEPDHFALVYKTLMHPRCLNCHPAGDAPLQYDDSRVHGQNISRRCEKNGVPCATCHREKNGTQPNTPPGAPNWRLPPEATPMVFQGRTPKQLCEQLKDPAPPAARISRRSCSTWRMTRWWRERGPGRKPIPWSRASVVAAMKAWVAAGAPCP